MPTLPGPPSRDRDIAESFGVDAERYDRVRPRYPEPLIARVRDLAPGDAVLAVGSGTGTDARQFQEAGATVLGVEPDARMAAFSRARGLATEEATFEDWEPAGRTFDAVVAGTSWHWVDPVVGAARAATVLRPGGVLALYGHVFNSPEPIAQAYDEAFAEVAPGSPLARRGGDSAVASYQALYDSFAERLHSATGFDASALCRFEHEQSYSSEQWIDLLRTTGALTSLQPWLAATVLERVRRAVNDLGGEFVTTHNTILVTAIRLPAGAAPKALDSPTYGPPGVAFNQG